MSDDAVPIDSDALRVNAPHTAQDVLVPAEFTPIVDAVSSLTGVHAALATMLREYFHGFRNMDTVVGEIGALHLRHWDHLARDPRADELFVLVAELTSRLFGDELTPTQLSSLLRSTFTWCRTVVTAGGGDDAVMARLLARVAGCLPDGVESFLERDNELRDLVRALTDGEPARIAAELYRDVLLAGLGRLHERLDIPAWARGPEAALDDVAGITERFAFLDGDRVAAAVDHLRTADADALRAPELRNYSGMLADTLAQLPRIADLTDRFGVCLFLLKDDTLGYRQEQALAALLHVVKQLVKPGPNTDTEVVLARLTEFFRDRDNEFLMMRLHCYEAIGRAIGQAGNARAADHLLDDLLSWKFQYPEIAGATDDWETLVNPFHLPKIRCWMRIIESNPALFERLAAALNVQLRLGGVHIADTDLFQRDITQFLNADIRPIYFVAKQLLRVFPVYFTEVGAEGELRAASTHFDEITMRRDTLSHFLRKQVHAESSNRLVPFSREVIRYWATLDPSPLAPYLSDNTMAAVLAERGWAVGPHRLLVDLMQRRGVADVDALVDELLVTDHAALHDELTPKAEYADDATRVAMVVRTHQLLRSKYSLVSDDTVADVVGHRRLPQAVRDAFRDAHAAWREQPGAAERDALLDAGLDVLAQLKAVILDDEETEADERLYRKRHIAAGIPSIYGTYREPKFDALGLSLRVETLVARLMEDIVNAGVEPYVTRDTLRRMHATMRRFIRALEIDGVESDAFSQMLDMLEASFSMYSFTFHQYLNVFQMLARAMSDVSSRSVRSHGQILRAILAGDPRITQSRNLGPDAIAEIVLREVLVSGLGIQTLDRYVGQYLHKLSRLNDKLPVSALTRMMNYDPERLVWHLSDSGNTAVDLATLGFKGFGLHQMSAEGIRVPEGFVLSTELFHTRAAMGYRPLYDETEARVRQALARLENETGRRLADPVSPLLLSVRSGSPVSMPGLMTTFVNVGLNPHNAEDLAERSRFGWAVWDSLRRSAQTWAMSDGIGRDVFHRIMLDAKDRWSVAQKHDFTVEQMRQIALSYWDAARDHGTKVPVDPFEQVMEAIWRVVDSWDGDGPTLFRQHTGVAENWGTAVICQRMVFGNLGRESGSGVAFTTNPLEPYSHQVRLFGDFTVASQGEDLVGGLVHPLPLSESQRKASPIYTGSDSLETRFPEVYAALLEVARELAGSQSADPQEIEFTFESPTADGLYILQKRAVVPEQQANAPYFDTSGEEPPRPIAVGMGVAGGAYVGRVALDEADVDRLTAAGDEPVLLVRRDTVPEDLGMIARVAGVLTGRGGATSHAAVTAKRLSKNCVVGVPSLEVSSATVTITGHVIRSGDWLSIDGRTGNIFLGRLPLAGRD